MTRYLFMRAGRLVLVFVLATMGLIYLVDLTPGDPAVAIAGETAPPEVLAQVREQYGLDDPVLVRWADWMGGVLGGDLGTSQISQEPLTTILAERVPVTLQLALMAMVIAIAITVPLALVSAYRSGSWIDRASQAWSSAVVAVPSFVIALILMLVFALTLRLFPVANWVQLTDDPLGNLRSALLPALALGVSEAAILLPVLRADVGSTLEQDYITLARSKGISSTRILLRHALRPSSISLVTLLGLALARAFGGAVIVETVFNLPGIGSRLIGAIRNQDLIVTQGLVMFIAIIYILANFAVDLAYSRLDPRVVKEGS